MSLPLICERRINAFDRARAHLQSSAWSQPGGPAAKSQAAVRAPQRGVRFERLDRAEAWPTVRVHSHNTKASPCLKLIRCLGRRIYHARLPVACHKRSRSRRAAPDALDAVGQPPITQKPSGVATQTQHSKPSGQQQGQPPNSKQCPPSCAPRARPSRGPRASTTSRAPSSRSASRPGSSPRALPVKMKMTWRRLW